MHVCMHVRVYVCVCVWVCACVYVCMYMYVIVYAYVCTYSYTQVSGHSWSEARRFVVIWFGVQGKASGLCFRATRFSARP